jgi:LAO/AO transport system kinase
MGSTRDLLSPADLVGAARGGDRRALAGLISRVERGGAPARELAAVVHKALQGSYTVGLTGAPGAGKSTLTDGLIARVRADDAKVAVVAVDPSSPFTGGAILGDRVRLREQHAVDDRVYVRSLANRGHLGGLARAVPEVVHVLDATGWPWVVLETVGVGQAEVGIAAQADTTLVVLNPGWGDEVQANKAGLLEVADVLVVNKCDRPGAAEAVKHLKGMLALAPPRAWVPPIVRTSAVSEEGLDDLWAAVRAHRAHLEQSGELERGRGERRVKEVRQRVIDDVAHLAAEAERAAEGQELMRAVADGTIDTTTAAADLVAAALRRLRG